MIKIRPEIADIQHERTIEKNQWDEKLVLWDQ